MCFLCVVGACRGEKGEGGGRSPGRLLGTEHANITVKTLYRDRHTIIGTRRSRRVVPPNNNNTGTKHFPETELWNQHVDKFMDNNVYIVY